MGIERRQAKRWRGRLRSAKLFDASRRFLVSCRVFDISDTGARLQPESAASLPANIFYWADDDGEYRPASVVWSRQSQIGIHFLTPKSATR